MAGQDERRAEAQRDTSGRRSLLAGRALLLLALLQPARACVDDPTWECSACAQTGITCAFILANDPNPCSAESGFGVDASCPTNLFGQCEACPVLVQCTTRTSARAHPT